MHRDEVDFKQLPDTPGVYVFRGARRAVLYVGKAACLRDRIRSYFSSRLTHDRGVRIADMLDKAKKVETIETDSILDALVLEANIIKKYQPLYNVREKSNKSFYFVCITNEEFPRVMKIRGRELAKKKTNPCRSLYGPFPQGGVLTEAMRIIRKLLPYRDTCTPQRGKACFNAQLGLCPGVCHGNMSKSAYTQRIREIRLLFEGKKKRLITMLEKQMKQYAKEERFEQAEELQKRIFSLKHIRDASLIKREFAEGGEEHFRTEAYDIAHLQGQDTVGVMVVSINGEPQPSEYRTFDIRWAKKQDDVGALKEVVTRRFRHGEWQYPNLIVVDGGNAQLAAVENVCRDMGMSIPIVSVVKDKRHKPREILGAKNYAHAREEEILHSNAEAHRFAIRKHRKKREKLS